jgi:long-subunit fatty acid transport protein
VRRRSWLLLPLSFALALALVPRAAAGNPVDAFGFGARAPAMAGAQTAAATDGSANYYNPALLATFDDIQVDIGYQTAVPSLYVNGLDLGVDSSRGIAVALSSPGRIGKIQLALAGGLFLPDQHILRARSLEAGKPRFALYDNRPQRLFLGANLAVRLGERFAVGGGIAYMANTIAAVDLVGRLGFPDPNDSDLALAIDADVEEIRYPQAGALFHATPWLDIGLSFRGGYTLFLDNTVRVLADVGREDDPVVENGRLELTALAQDLFQPQQWSAGLAARLTGRLLVAFDASLHRWSRFDNPATRIDLELDAGMFNDLIDIPDTPPLPDPNYHDIVIPRLGIEYQLYGSERRDLDLRAGYAYEPSPVPEQVGESNFIDNDKHTTSAGLGLTLRGWTEILPRPLRLDVYGAVTFLAPRTHHKLSPVDPVGDYRSSGRLVQLGLSSTWHF